MGGGRGEVIGHTSKKKKHTHTQAEMSGSVPGITAFGPAPPAKRYSDSTRKNASLIYLLIPITFQTKDRSSIISTYSSGLSTVPVARFV